jgi:uncharacterized SAM-binding protein YcdF (DUF218 family)
MASSGYSSQKLWGLLIRKERLGLSWRGWLLVASIVVLTSYGVLLNVHPFLAVTRRVNANVLVVEGWIQRYAIREAADEFNRGSYQHIFTTGGPENGSGGYVNDYQTSASVGADALKRVGVPEELVQMAPSHVTGQERTYSSAIALRDWFREHNITVQSMNVVTEDCHARRTQLLFQKVFGKNVPVGIIAVPNPDYNSKYWWRYSDGVREVIGESIAYMYARFLFYPSASPRAKKMVEASQRPVHTQQ